jgi:hypothetical protein
MAKAGAILALVLITAMLPRAAWGDAPAGDQAVPPPAAVTFEDFHDGLAPYGSWERSPREGWIWRPRVEAGWRPYYHGEWTYTDRGWYWSSDEPWSWATYHYGRWIYGPEDGWAWLPGYEWAPAWVAWRSGAGVIGWAPLAPYAAGGLGGPVYFGWTFVPAVRFSGFAVERYALAPGVVEGLWPRTVASAGPGRRSGSRAVRPGYDGPPVPRPGPGAVLRDGRR